jgi:hypothetical protein
VPPGQPHLLAGGVEGHGEAGQHPVARAERGAAQEDARLRVDERRGAAVGDGHALGRAGGARGEDDPGVVVRARRRGLRGALTAQGEAQPGAEHGAHPRLAEHQRGPLLRVLDVDRDVGGAAGEHAEHGYIEVGRAGGDAHPDAVAAAHSGAAEPLRQIGDLGAQREVIQSADAIVERGRPRVPGHGGVEHVEQGSGGRRGGGRTVAGGSGEQRWGHGGLVPRGFVGR